MAEGSSLVEKLRKEARRLFDVALAAADPAKLTSRALAEGGWLESLVESRARGGRSVIVAFGKAAPKMARAALDQVRSQSEEAVSSLEGLVVQDRRSGPASGDVDGQLAPLRTLSAGHPIPDRSSVVAGEAALAGVRGLREQDLVLVLVSGGGSALLAAPRPPVTLEDKVLCTRLLLASGATIDDMNCVRKHLSAIKGGQLTAAAGPARVEALLLSDVVGDDPSSIASGPTVPDPSTFLDALFVLDRAELRPRVPASVRSLLEAGAAGGLVETPKPDDPCFERTEYRIIGSNTHSLRAIDRAVKGNVVLFEEPTVGEACYAGELWASRLADLLSTEGRVVAVAGGETTVTLDGPATGRGGRSQELALAFALAAERRGLDQRPWVLLSAGSDGIDGPTDAAGALVDSGTLERCRSRGVDPRAALERHDSYGALDASLDLLRVGATGTNVADVQILLISESTSAA